MSIPAGGLRRLSITRKLLLISAVYILIITGLLVLAQLALGFLSDVRSYVGGEGLWSKGQKDAVYHLATYVALQREADYQRYQRAMQVPLGDHLARLELSRPSPDLNLAGRGFVAGRNHADDVHGMATFFRRFGSVSYLAAAIRIWAQADDALAELGTLADRVHREMQAGSLSKARQDEILRQISVLNDRLTVLEDSFSFTLGAGARAIRSWVSLAMWLLTALALAAGVTLSGLISRQIGQGILTLRAGTRRVSGGDLDERITVESADEIGELAEAFNGMTASLGRHIAALEQARAALAEMDRLKTQFFANVSHELRTPLALILGPAERLLQRPDLPLNLRRDATVIERNAHLLLKHVNDLLDVARLDAGRAVVHYTVLDTGRLVRRVASHFEVLAEERHIELVVTAPSVPTWIDADPEKLERVLVNLLANAFKFTPDGGRIEVGLALHEAEIELTVSDNGPGVPAALRQAIFERFRQSDGEATRRHGGTGLGLAIVHEFVKLHQGRVWVQEAPAQGADFHVVLPRQAPAGSSVTPAAGTPGGPRLAATAGLPRPILEELRRLPPADTDTGTAANATTGGAAGADSAEPAAAAPLVLVVEDNAEMNRFIVETLAPSYRTASAADGEEGLARAIELQPDLVISDVMMPRRSGDQLLAQLRAHPRLADIPFMVLTAKADDALRVRLLREGAQDYLIKPFSAAELVTRAANLITVKRTRDELERELSHREEEGNHLAAEASRRRRDLAANLSQLHRREIELRLALQEREILLKEVQHRVKNNLQVIASLLSLQSAQIGAAEPAAAVLRQCQARIRSMALIHDKLYERDDLSRIDFGAYVQALVGNLLSTHGGFAGDVRAEVAVGELPLAADVAIPVGLIVHELVSNALLHAFPAGRGGCIWVEGRRDPGCPLRLSVRDDGAGLPPDVDLDHPATLGLQLVSSLSAHLGATLTHCSGPGTSFTLEVAA